MKILKYISLVMVLILTASCDKNEVEYNTESISEMAEFQLHYFVPVTATTTNNIYKVVVNGDTIANKTAPLSTYNAIPNGSVGRFYTVKPGKVNIKLYMSTAFTLVYDKDVTLNVGKQNIFVYDFNKDPIIFDNGYPYQANLTEDTDSTCYVKFYNFLYETTGATSTLKLQYQYTDPRTGALVNIGKPVSFGETTGWQPVKIVKSLFNSSGYCPIVYKIKVVNADGSIGDDLMLWNSNKKYVAYTATTTEYIGRRYHHILGGMRSALPIASTRQFTAL